LEVNASARRTSRKNNLHARITTHRVPPSRRGKVIRSEIFREGNQQESLASEMLTLTNKTAMHPTSIDKDFPALPFPGSSVDKKQSVDEHLYYTGFRKDYDLGEAARSTSHMIIEPTSTDAVHAVSSLRAHDYAFVQRTDGSFSYALFAYRCMKPFKSRVGNKVVMEECMVFVVSSDGSTKLVRKRQRGFVRLVSTDGLVDRKPCQKIREHKSTVDWVPPHVVAFVPPMDGDECSLISSVSDRARGLR
jgi:hypothetical protein